MIRNTLYLPFYLYCRIVYRIKLEKYRGDKKQPYLILFNHQTGVDQFFVSMSFPKHVYYISSEDLFSNSWISRLLSWAVAPIPFRKSTSDIAAIKNCMRIAREGGSIGMAPEGNRTYSGKTEYMNPSIAPLARKLGLPIVLYHIKGGYGVQPRWADNVRRGRIDCFVSKVIEPEEYMSLSDGELYDLIKDGLYVNEANSDNRFIHTKSAEHLERVFYVCPRCGFSTFESYNEVVECKKCRMMVRYLPTTELQAAEGDFPYRFVNDWYEAQSEYVNSTDVTTLTDTPVFTDNASFFEVIPYKKKRHIADGCKIELYGDRITVLGDGVDESFSFDECSAVTVLGRNKVDIYFGDKIYQIKGEKFMNGIKYVHFYNRYRNIRKGDTNGKFLGL